MIRSDFLPLLPLSLPFFVDCIELQAMRSEPTAKAEPKKANTSMKKLDSRAKLQDLRDASAHMLVCAAEMDAMVAALGCTSPRLTGTIRKFRSAAAGVDATSDEVTKDVKKRIGSHSEYAFRRMKKSRGIMAATAMPPNVLQCIKSAEAAGVIGNRNRFGTKEGAPPKKKRKSTVLRRLSAQTTADKKVTAYDVTIQRPAETVRIMVPDPSNGSTYQPLEVATVLSRVDKRYRTKLASLWNEKGLVPVTDDYCYRVCKNYLEGKKIAETWGDKHRGGRPPIMDLADVEASREAHFVKNGGLSFKPDDVKRWLITQHNSQRIANGGIADPTWEPAPSTVKNYYELFTADPSVELSKKAQGQTNTRFAAGTSERALVCLVVGECYSKYRIGEPSASHPMRENPGTKGAQELERLVSKYYGNAPVYTIHPSLINNTDDTKMYTCKTAMGRGQAKGNYVFTAHQSSLKVQQNSPKVRDDAPVVANGVSVKPTFTLSAGGFVAPFYVTVYGLTERELPREKTPSGIRIVPIEGFCVGSLVDLRHVNARGYVVLCRADVDAESVSMRNFLHYHQEIYLKQHVDVIREVAFDYDSNMEVDDYLESYGSFDGATDQLSAVTQKEIMGLSRSRRNTMVKHNKSRSMREQPADCGDIFKLLKFQDKITSSEHQPSQFLANKINATFTRLQNEGIVYLGKKRGPLESFLATFPEATRKVISPEKIQQGYIRMGAIDKESKCRPDMDVLLNTLAGDDKEKQSRLKAVKGIIVAHFDEFMNDFRDYGRIREETLNQHFVEDYGMDGESMPCPETLAKLSQGRYTVLTNENIANELEGKQMEVENEKKAKAGRERAVAMKYLEDAALFEQDLVKLDVPRDSISEDVLLKHGTTTVAKLLGYVVSRNSSDAAAAAKFKKTQTKKILVRRALEVIATPVLLSLASEDEGGDDEEPRRLAPDISLTPSDAVMASDLLRNAGWTDNARMLFEDIVVHCLSNSDISQDDCERADVLSKLLLSRLRRLKEKKIINTDKHKHYALSWYASNTPVMAALMVLFKHCVGNVSCIKLDECLLSGPENFADLDDCEDSMGAYLVFDMVRRVFCRSGKAHSAKRDAAPRTFGVRRTEHKEDALNNPEKSNFHSSYPHKNARRDTGEAIRGYFDDLNFKAALGWKHRVGPSGAKILTSSISNGGLFVWDDATMNRLGSTKSRLQVKEVQMDLVAYLIESTYDIALEKSKNVSASAGWERFLLEFA